MNEKEGEEMALDLDGQVREKKMRSLVRKSGASLQRQKLTRLEDCLL